MINTSKTTQMQANSDPTTPRSQEGTEPFPDIVALYLRYWET